jgi:hypothetical protein
MQQPFCFSFQLPGRRPIFFSRDVAFRLFRKMENLSMCLHAERKLSNWSANSDAQVRPCAYAHSMLVRRLPSRYDARNT